MITAINLNSCFKNTHNKKYKKCVGKGTKMVLEKDTLPKNDKLKEMNLIHLIY